MRVAATTETIYKISVITQRLSQRRPPTLRARWDVSYITIFLHQQVVHVSGVLWLTSNGFDLLDTSLKTLLKLGLDVAILSVVKHCLRGCF